MQLVSFRLSQPCQADASQQVSEEVCYDLKRGGDMSWLLYVWNMLFSGVLLLGHEPITVVSTYISNWRIVLKV